MSNKRKETDEYSFENVHECYIYSWLETYINFRRNTYLRRARRKHNPNTSFPFGGVKGQNSIRIIVRGKTFSFNHNFVRRLIYGLEYTTDDIKYDQKHPHTRVKSYINELDACCFIYIYIT